MFGQNKAWSIQISLQSIVILMYFPDTDISNDNIGLFIKLLKLWA